MRKLETVRDVGEFLDVVGRELFKAQAYDELDEELAVFFAANTAGTVPQSKSKFYRSSLPGLIGNFIFPLHAAVTGHAEWLREFSELIRHIDPASVSEEHSLSSYLMACAWNSVPLRHVMKDIVLTITVFVARHPEYSTSTS